MLHLAGNVNVAAAVASQTALLRFIMFSFVPSLTVGVSQDGDAKAMAVNQ